MYACAHSSPNSVDRLGIGFIPLWPHPGRCGVLDAHYASLVAYGRCAAYRTTTMALRTVADLRYSVVPRLVRRGRRSNHFVVTHEQQVWRLEPNDASV